MACSTENNRPSHQSCQNSVTGKEIGCRLDSQSKQPFVAGMVAGGVAASYTSSSDVPSSPHGVIVSLLCSAKCS